MCWTGGDTNLFCDGCVFGWSATFVRMICNRCTVSVYIYIYSNLSTPKVLRGVVVLGRARISGIMKCVRRGSGGGRKHAKIHRENK